MKTFLNQWDICLYEGKKYVIIGHRRKAIRHKHSLISGYSFILGDVNTLAKICYADPKSVEILDGHITTLPIYKKRLKYYFKESVRQLKYYLHLSPRYFIPIRQITPKSYEISWVKTCPMDLPSGSVFYMEYKYKEKE